MQTQLFGTRGRRKLEHLSKVRRSSARKNRTGQQQKRRDLVGEGLQKSLLPLKKAERILRTQTKRGRGRKLIIEIEIEYDMEEEEENGCCRSHEKKWRNRTEKPRWIPLQPTRLITREGVTQKERA